MREPCANVQNSHFRTESCGERYFTDIADTRQRGVPVRSRRRWTAITKENTLSMKRSPRTRQSADKAVMWYTEQCKLNKRDTASQKPSIKVRKRADGDTEKYKFRSFRVYCRSHRKFGKRLCYQKVFERNIRKLPRGADGVRRRVFHISCATEKK